METFVWIAQIILALKFLSTGIIHGFSLEKPAIKSAVERLGGSARIGLRLAGILMLLGSLGLILPLSIGILPILGPLSAAVFAVMLLVSIPLHIKSRDKPMIWVSGILFVLCAFVVYGRWVLFPM